MATLAERAKGVLTPKDQESRVKVPQAIEDKMKRGRARMREGATQRNECLEFWRGNQYVYRGDDGILVNQNTITLANGRGKPRHRVRTTRNLIFDIVAHEVSAAIKRVPGYEVNPTKSDPETLSAARLSGKVAYYGYDKWSLRQMVKRVITYAVVADEGFAWPFWDSSVAPFYTDDDGSVYGQGEIGIRILGPNEVYWEPGLKFDESRWHAVEQARTLESVYQMEGYSGPPKLTPDATADDMPSKGRESQHNELVLVTDYLERPCPKYPNGRWLTTANGKQILPERPFPCTDHKGNVVDEPVLHALSYITDPDADRDMGLVRHLLDAQRTINDCINKMLEWKNLMMNPQVIIRNGEFKQRLTDEPGQVYHAVGSGEITVREVGEVPQSLLALKDMTITDLARIAAQNDIPGQVESGKGIAELLEKDQQRRSDFIGDLAEFHSRLMRHCLYLVQKHYTEPRLITVQGRRGPRNIDGFMGADLRGQVDVTVYPGSIEPRTRADMTRVIMAYADRGWIDPDSAMQALNSGDVEGLIESIALDEGRVNEIIQMISDGTFMEQPPRPVFPGEDPGYEVEPEYQLDETGQPVLDEMGEPVVITPGILATTVPGWMPRPFDRIPIHKQEMEDWMKSQDWALLEDEQKQAGMVYYSALISLEQMQAAQAAEAQALQAEELGMDNASKDQKTKPLPDQAKATGEVFGPRYEAGSQETF
jgi:hypothetical protein